MRKNTLALSSIGGIVASLVLVMPVMAATTVVTPTDPQGWSTADTRPGGSVTFELDADTPSGDAALQLATVNDPAAKAQYMHQAMMPIADLTELGYHTKQVSASFVQGDASYQLPVMLNGAAGGFTTFVYEPYQNGVVLPGVWQEWDVDAGQFWSSRSVTCSNGVVVAGGGGAPFYTLAEIETLCPDANVVGFGVNIGSNNPDWTVRVDLVNFNGDVYDFELVNTPTSKDQCKNGGWKNLTNADGVAFKNQGDCVSSVASAK